jgi:pimeloyl-ACP methyl ester carboxylesterase
MRFGIFLTSLLVVSLVQAGPRSGQADGDQARIHYLDAGRAGAACSLVLIPGWGADASVWRAQIGHFSAQRRVLALDPRSQGESQKTADGNTPEQRARDYERVLAALHVERAVLVGWSQGVQDVAAYVEQFGTRRLCGIVLVDAAVSQGAVSVATKAKATQALLERVDLYARHPREYLDGMVHAIYARALDDAERKALVDAAARTPTATGVAQLVADLLGPDRTPALRKFDKPALVVAAADSPELAEQKAQALSLPHGRFAPIENAGHGVFVDQPDAFLEGL